MSGQAAKTVDQLRNEFLATNTKIVVRMEDELQQLVNMLSFQRQALMSEMADGMGYKGVATDPKLLQKLKDLTAAFNSATDSKIRIEKTAKQRAEAMTPEEEREAVAIYVKSLDHPTRRALIKELVDYHNSFTATGAPVKEAQ